MSLENWLWKIIPLISLLLQILYRQQISKSCAATTEFQSIRIFPIKRERLQEFIISFQTSIKVLKVFLQTIKTNPFQYTKCFQWNQLSLLCLQSSWSLHSPIVLKEPWRSHHSTDQCSANVEHQLVSIKVNYQVCLVILNVTSRLWANNQDIECHLWCVSSMVLWQSGQLLNISLNQTL